MHETVPSRSLPIVLLEPYQSREVSRVYSRSQPELWLPWDWVFSRGRASITHINKYLIGISGWCWIKQRQAASCTHAQTQVEFASRGSGSCRGAAGSPCLQWACGWMILGWLFVFMCVCAWVSEHVCVCARVSDLCNFYICIFMWLDILISLCLYLCPWICTCMRVNATIVFVLVNVDSLLCLWRICWFLHVILNFNIFCIFIRVDIVLSLHLCYSLSLSLSLSFYLPPSLPPSLYEIRVFYLRNCEILHCCVCNCGGFCVFLFGIREWLRLM